MELFYVKVIAVIAKNVIQVNLNQLLFRFINKLGRGTIMKELKNLKKLKAIFIYEVDLKKTRNGAMSFGMLFIQNMQRISEICKSHSDLFKKVIFLCIIFLLSSTAYAGIDEAGSRIYYKLVSVGKWVIIIKGGIDIIQSIMNGDSQGAKKCFVGYLFAYGVLWALPWCMDEIEVVFKEI